jgi:DNA-binding beta-propeller fold protein YncE
MVSFTEIGKHLSFTLVFLSLFAVKGSASVVGRVSARRLDCVMPAALTVIPSSHPPEQESEKQASKVRIERWRAPKPGWLFVLDSWIRDPQILLLDRETGAIQGVIKTGYDPDMALSPDGMFLYLTSSDPALLSVLDTHSGNVIHEEPVSDLRRYVMFWDTAMAVSRDGQWLYLHKMRPGPIGNDHHSISIFDTRLRQFLPEEAALPDCGGTRLLLAYDERELFVLCRQSNDFRVLRFAPDGSTTSEKQILWPWTRPTRIYVGKKPDGSTPESLSAVGGGIQVIRADSTIVEMNPDNGAYTEISSFLPADRVVVGRNWASSTSGARLYVGSHLWAQPGQEGVADQIHVIDTRTWSEIGSIRPSLGCWLLATDRHDKYVYCASGRGNGAVSIIDAVSLKEVKVLRQVGVNPAFIIAAP